MKLKHQFQRHSAEKEVNDTAPLGIFTSNKLGGMMFFDAKRQLTQYYASIGNKPIKTIHNIAFEGQIISLNNRFHSLEIETDKHKYGLFAPYYMNAILITPGPGTPLRLEIDTRDINGKEGVKSHEVSQKNGRIIIKSIISSPEDGSVSTVYTAIQGEKMTYDHDNKKGNTSFSIDVMSSKITIAMSLTEQEAIVTADHLFQNENRIKEIQQDYITTSTDFSDSESALAYACVLNGTDHMLLPDQEKGNALIPIPHFSKVDSFYTTMAVHALLIEGEYGTAKNTLLAELERQQRRTQEGKASFEETAWPVLALGRFLNKLSADGKLYKYFSQEDIKKTAKTIESIAGLISQKYNGKPYVETEYGLNLESQALALAVYSLAYALTKSDEHRRKEERLRKDTRMLFLEHTVTGMEERGRATKSDVLSIFLTAYIYPLLLDKEEWKESINKLLDRMHNDFRTLRSKMLEETQDSPLDLELFGLTSLAAIVLNRVDPEHYERQVNNLLRSLVNDTLYKGIIGRPTSAYDHDVDLEKEEMISNTHILNNTLFLEMLRECA